MPDNPSAQFEELGWGLEVDLELEELRLVHFETGNAFVLDAEGSLTVLGEADIGGELRDLQSLLTSALEEYSQPSERCGIDCEEPIRIASAERISLDAPTIELSADADLVMASRNLEMTSTANMTAESSGLLTLRGALLRLN